MLRRRSLAVVLATVFVSSSPALSQPKAPATPAPAATTATPAVKPAPAGSATPAATATAAGEGGAAPVVAPAEEARKHFERGLLLFDDEVWDAAYAEFVRSRTIQPTRAATKNAAICARKLKRHDEALDLFEELLRFANVPLDDAEMAKNAVKSLAALVGTVDVRGAPEGATVVVDARQRGVAPMSPLRLPVGTHVVRVYKEGFEAFETRVDVAGGQAAMVEARLAKLAQSGSLKVIEQGGGVLDVVVDNVVVGKTPWEGTLAPGDHMVLLRGEGDIGTQPAAAPVRINQVTPLTLRAEPLTARLRIEPTPAGASIAVDGVALGRGTWEGRLRPGTHRIEVAAEGFVALSRSVTPGPGKVEVVSLQLDRDPSSSLWADHRGRFFVELDGAFALVPSLGGEVAGGCGEGCARSLGLGFSATGRGGYRFVSGFALGAEAGYLLVTQSTSGRAAFVEPVGLAPNPGRADDKLTLQGPALGVSAGFHFGERFPVTLRVGAGALIASLQDRRTGTFSTVARPSAPATSYDVDVIESKAATSIYVAPEARIGWRIGGRFDLSLGVRALVLIGVEVPAWAPDEKRVNAATDGQGTFPADALSDRVVVGVAPSLGARYEF